MKMQVKYSLHYCEAKIKDALRKMHRGSMSREEGSRIIQEYGRKIGEKEVAYEPDEVLDFSKRWDVV